MGFEWSIKTKNKPLIESLPLIQKCLISEGIENFTADSVSISVPPSGEHFLYGKKHYSDWGMEFIIKDDYLYHLNYTGEGIVERIRQVLEENGFGIKVEEL